MKRKVFYNLLYRLRGDAPAAAPLGIGDWHVRAVRGVPRTLERRVKREYAQRCMQPGDFYSLPGMEQGGEPVVFQMVRWPSGREKVAGERGTQEASDVAVVQLWCIWQRHGEGYPGDSFTVYAREEPTEVLAWPLADEYVQAGRHMETGSVSLGDARCEADCHGMRGSRT